MSKKVLNLAVEISNTRDSEVPVKLLKVADLLINADNPTTVRTEIIQFDILTAISVSLKHEYGHVRNGWTVAVDLLKIFCDCVNGFNFDEKSFKNELLPTTMQNILILARKFQEKHIRSKGLSDEYLFFFKNVMKQFSILHTNYPHLLLNTLKSGRLLQLLIADELETATIVINVLKDLFSIQINVIHKLDEKTLNSILDEVIYKLTTSDLLEVAKSSVNLLLLLCKLDLYFNKLLNRRYKGLKMLLSRWYGKGIGKELSELSHLMDSADQTRTVDQRTSHYATMIQKTWRGYRARNVLKKASLAFSKFHLSYRRKKEEAANEKQYKMAQSELKFQLALEHCRKLRKRNLTMAELIKIVPANEIDKYLLKQKETAVILIQSHYRGYLQRKQLDSKRDYVERFRAAVSIQRAVRRWLNRIRKRKQEPSFYSRPPGLTVELREKLFDQIRSHIDSLPPHPREPKEVATLHEKAQKKFQEYVYSQKSIRKQQQQIEVSLALASHDSDLLINCPRLTEVTQEDIDSYYSNKSVPVMLAAKEAHRLSMKKERAKWHELLLYDSDSDEENDEIEFSNLINIYDQFSFNFNKKKDGLKRAVVPKSEKDRLKTTTFRKAATLSWLEGYDD